MTVAISFVAGVFGIALVYFLWSYITARIKSKAAKEIVEKEMNKILQNAEEEKRSLPDPERPFSSKELNDALNRIRARGRDPE